MIGVLYSTNRPHTDNIKSGRKLWEIRKSKPNIPVPFPAFIYETKKKGGCGKVIGEMIIAGSWEIPVNKIPKWCIKDGWVSEEFLKEYANGKEYLYANVIHMAHRYDKPKEISEFYKCPRAQCDKCYGGIMNERLKKYGRCAECLRLTRPPQSRCYVEV